MEDRLYKIDLLIKIEELKKSGFESRGLDDLDLRSSINDIKRYILESENNDPDKKIKKLNLIKQIAEFEKDINKNGLSLTEDYDMDSTIDELEILIKKNCRIQKKIGPNLESNKPIELPVKEFNTIDKFIDYCNIPFDVKEMRSHFDYPDFIYKPYEKDNYGVDHFFSDCKTEDHVPSKLNAYKEKINKCDFGKHRGLVWGEDLKKLLSKYDSKLGSELKNKEREDKMLKNSSTNCFHEINSESEDNLKPEDCTELGDGYKLEEYIEFEKNRKKAFFSKKLNLLSKLNELINEGVKLTKNYDIESDYDEMQIEYEFHKNIRKKEQGKKTFQTIFISIINLIEKYGYFGNYDELAKYLKNNINDYSDILYELYEKYGTETDLPEIKILKKIMSAFMEIYLTSSFNVRENEVEQSKSSNSKINSSNFENLYNLYNLFRTTREASPAAATFNFENIFKVDKQCKKESEVKKTEECEKPLDKNERTDNPELEELQMD
jgi:hypothetical protein